MYSMKPIYQNSENIDIPDVMYKMKSLHAKDESTCGNSSEALSPRMQQLEERQMIMLKKLENLENEVKQISKQLGHNYGDAAPVIKKSNTCSLSSTRGSSSKALPEGTLDFVISVSAKNPSFSPLLLGQILKIRGVNVAFPTHVHSSCKEGSITKDVLGPYGGVLNGRLGTCATAKVYFTFLVKDVPFCPSVMYSPMLQTRIIGDINIARYLSRILLPDLYEESSAEVIASIDQWIEVSKQIISGSSKEKDAALKSLNAHLGRKEQDGYVCNRQLTLASITLFSAILASRSNFSSLPKNVKMWFQNVATNFDEKLIGGFDVPSSWLSN